jgi:hypothetical protein
MTTFVLITSDPNVIAAIEKAYGQESFKYPKAKNVWFVADSGVTAQEVYRKLMAALGEGILEKDVTVVICSIAGYYGLASKNLWEWLAAKGSATSAKE